MAALLEPFSGYVPTSELAPRIVGPPISTLSPDQRTAAKMDPLSFRHVVGKGAGSSEEEAKQWLADCQKEGALDEVGPTILLYEQETELSTARGIIGDVFIGSYDAGFVKKHEMTIAKSERRMAKYMSSTRVSGNPVVLAHRPNDLVSSLWSEERAPDYSYTAADGVRHSMWAVEKDRAEQFCNDFREVLYITDGHHRLAAASSIATQDGRLQAHLPAGLFATDQLQLRTFARAVKTDIDPEEILRWLGHTHDMQPSDSGRPTEKHQVGVDVGGSRYLLRIDQSKIPADPYDSLDVNVLQDQILEPLFGIVDPRQDDRLRFIPDVPSEGNQGTDVRFLPYPASVEEVLSVADAGLAMPPKSTWFAPKLPSGLVIRLLDR